MAIVIAKANINLWEGLTKVVYTGTMAGAGGSKGHAHGLGDRDRVKFMFLTINSGNGIKVMASFEGSGENYEGYVYASDATFEVFTDVGSGSIGGQPYELTAFYD